MRFDVLIGALSFTRRVPDSDLLLLLTLLMAVLAPIGRGAHAGAAVALELITARRAARCLVRRRPGGLAPGHGGRLGPALELVRHARGRLDGHRHGDRLQGAPLPDTSIGRDIV